MTNFTQFGLPDELVASLEKVGIVTPTAVQMEAIPLAMQGMDVLVSAQTGTGKTVAYCLPLIAKLMNAPPRTTALILTPTRELAAQVNDALKKVVKANFKTALLIGGDSMFKQLAQLKQHPKIIIGTPGRVFDHLSRGSLKVAETAFLVIDEADRMLDMGFGIQLEQIAKYLTHERQTMMFSATMPFNIEKLARNYLKDPKRVMIGSTTKPAAKIKQEIIHTGPAEKFGLLLQQLTSREGSIIIFVKTKRSADRVAAELRREGQNADAIHGDLQQRRRERVIHSFRTGKNRIMVATDIAARGLDIPHIMHVINYDLPQSPEDYIHRVGRTARAGAEGSALCLVTPEDGHRWKAILRLISPEEASQYKTVGKPEKSFRKKGPMRSFGARPFGARAPRGGPPFDKGRSFTKRREGEGFPFTERKPREGFDERPRPPKAARPFGSRSRFEGFSDAKPLRREPFKKIEGDKPFRFAQKRRPFKPNTNRVAQSE